MNILNGVQNIFRDIFDDETLVITEKTNADEIEEWDSLSHIRLIAAIEDQFSIRFSFNEIQKMKNVGELVKTINEKYTNKYDI